MLCNILSKPFKRKLVAFVIFVLIIGGGYFGYKHFKGEGSSIRYVTAAVERGTIVASISGSGTVNLKDEVNLNFESSGKITNIYVKEGDEVKRGDKLARIDDTELRLSVASAKMNLASKEKQLEELLGGASPAELRLQETAVEIARLNLVEAKKDYDKLIANEPPEQRELDEAKNKMDELELKYLSLKKDYEDMQQGYSQLEIKKAQTTYDKALAAYQEANKGYSDLINNPTPTQEEIQAAQNKIDTKYAAYNEAFAHELLKLAEYNEDPDSTVKLREYELAKAQRQSAYTAWQNAIDDYNNIQSNPPSDQKDIETARNKMNELEIKYLEAKKDFEKKKAGYTQEELKTAEISANRALANWQKAKEDYENLLNNEPPEELEIAQAKNTVNKLEASYLEAQEKLEELKGEADENEIVSFGVQLDKAQLDLIETQNKLANAVLTSPIDGQVLISQEVGEKASSGGGSGGNGSSASSFMTIISKEHLAKISLNEVDVAKVKLGQLATLTFDAVEDLTLTGKVIEIDSSGSVTQGVVGYGIKIAFDVQDERVRPGMSVTADIITETKQDVLVLPNSAIKSQIASYYVELVEVDDNEFRQQLLANVSGIILPEPPKRQSVEIGFSNDLSTEIISGLKEGDIIVTSVVNSNAVETTQTQRVQGTQGFQMPGMGGQQISPMKGFR